MPWLFILLPNLKNDLLPPYRDESRGYKIGRPWRQSGAGRDFPYEELHYILLYVKSSGIAACDLQIAAPQGGDLQIPVCRSEDLDQQSSQKVVRQKIRLKPTWV